MIRIEPVVLECAFYAHSTRSALPPGALLSDPVDGAARVSCNLRI